MKKLSVVISARNEEAKIGRTLGSVSWADEIIIIDNESTDDTAAIAKKSGAFVYTRKNDLMLNRNKNFGFSKATGEWILNLDADEVVSPELAQEIKTATGSGRQFAGYWLQRKNISFGRWITHGLWWPDRQLRLFRRGQGSFPCKHIHEYIAVDGAADTLSEPLIHYNYETVSQYLAKLDRCTTSEAGYLDQASYRLSWTDAIRFPLSDFMKVYFAQKGYRDGLHGLVLALLQAFYAFVVFAKLWEKQGFRETEISLDSLGRELKYSGNTVAYWYYDGKQKEKPGFWSRLYYRFRKKAAGLLAKARPS